MSLLEYISLFRFQGCHGMIGSVPLQIALCTHSLLGLCTSAGEFLSVVAYDAVSDST